jgi:type IV pilus assembly protein PilQ
MITINSLSTTLRSLAAILVLLAASGAALAQGAQEAPRNVLQKLDLATAGDQVTLRMTFQDPLKDVPTGFSLADPHRIVLDFAATDSALESSDLSVSRGFVRNVRVAQTDARLRFVVNLDRPATFKPVLAGNDLVVTLVALAQVTPEGERSTAKPFAAPKQAAAKDVPLVRDVGFRRGLEGEGRVTIDLEDPTVGVDVRKQGGSVVVEFVGASVPDSLVRKLDVSDFATPVSSVTTNKTDDRVRVVVTPKPNAIWQHVAYQTDNKFVLEIREIVEDTSRLGGGIGRYTGERLSLRFREYPVREVLQAFSDFANFNIVISDAVTGTITLNLQDVPWDQALDVVLQQKNLSMDRRGSVVTIAPSAEILQRRRDSTELVAFDPVRDEIITLGFMRAEDAKARIEEYLKNDSTSEFQARGQGQAAGTQGGAFSGDYRAGRVSTLRITVDKETNKIFIRASEATLEAIRRLLKEIDVPPRQVLIESRIVEANEGFSRELGAKLGFTAAGSGARYDSQIAGGQNLSLPLSTSSVGQMQFYLASPVASRTLSLEINALESDSRGKVVSSPRVLTANGTPATIEDGQEIPYQTSSQGGTKTEFKKATLKLTVEPSINADGRISMKLTVNKDSPGAAVPTGQGSAIPINTKTVTTKVVVDNGGTVVIGGIYQENESTGETRVPFLGSLPVVGWLFRTKSDSRTRAETLIFITPRVVTEDLRLK